MDTDDGTQNGARQLFMPTMLAGTLLIGTFSAGVFVGRALSPTETTLRIVSPEGIQFKGLPRDKVDCLKWVAEYFDKPSAGIFSLVCNGRLP